jgi:hypothetical protein
MLRIGDRKIQNAIEALSGSQNGFSARLEKRSISAATRAKMAKAAKKRWAAAKAAKGRP